MDQLALSHTVPNTTVLHTVVCLCVSMDVHKHKCLDVFLFVKHLHVLLFSLFINDI